MAPSTGLFSRLRDRATSLGGKSSTHLDTASTSRTSSSRTSSEHVAPQVILTNEDTGSEHALSPTSGPRTPSIINEGPGETDSASTDEPAKSRPATSPHIPISNSQPPSIPPEELLTPRYTHNGIPSDVASTPRPNLDLPPFSPLGIPPVSPDQPQPKSPSRKSSLASIVLRKQGSRQSLNSAAAAPPAVPAVSSFPRTNTLGTLGTNGPDSDSVSIRSSRSDAGKKKKRWSGKKTLPPSSGIAGAALAASGMSLTYPVGVSPPSLPVSRVSPKHYKAPSKNGHVPRTSIDSVLLPRRDAHSPRSSEEVDPFPEELSDDIYDSPDALSFQEDDIPVTGFAVASSKRNADFHELFPEIAEGDYLIEGM